MNPPSSIFSFTIRRLGGANLVKVYYNSKMNAYLGGVLFIDGIAEFTNEKDGIDFANRYYLKYEKIEPVKKVISKKVK